MMQAAVPPAYNSHSHPYSFNSSGNSSSLKLSNHPSAFKLTAPLLLFNPVTAPVKSPKTSPYKPLEDRSRFRARAGRARSSPTKPMMWTDLRDTLRWCSWDAVLVSWVVRIAYLDSTYAWSRSSALSDNSADIAVEKREGDATNSGESTRKRVWKMMVWRAAGQQRRKFLGSGWNQQVVF
jgi:hypothetical protein